MKLALAGNPNCGKTTLFNKITGENAHTGNFPGVTVEKRSAFLKSDRQCEVVDLPGTYSLMPYSPEESAAVNFIKYEKPDVIISIIDICTAARGLYLTLQLIETGANVIVAANMADEAEKRGISVDYGLLGALLGVPAIPVCAAKGIGVDLLIQRAKECALKKSEPHTFECINKTDYIKSAEKKYRFIEQACGLAVKMPESKTGFNADRLFTNKYLSLPIFIAMVAAAFYVIFAGVGRAGSLFLLRAVEGISAAAETALKMCGVSLFMRRFVAEGIFGGIGSVLSFLPSIVLLFTLFCILEDSGYMSRIAFICDGFLKKIGLSGKAVMPLISGLGCSVPAIESARTLERKKERALTVLLIPYMSCSAKLPVYTVISAYFFKSAGIFAVAAAYLTGLIFLILCGYALKKTVFAGSGNGYISELPPYRLPRFENIAKSVYRHAADFISKAFTVIFAASVIIWLMQNLGTDFMPEINPEKSLLAAVGNFISPAVAPLGFGRGASAALISGFGAKEAIISTFTVLGYSGNAMSQLFSPPSAAAFMTFVLLYPPCISALAAIRREVGMRLAALCFAGQLAVAWCAAFAVYRLCCLLVCIF